MIFDAQAMTSLLTMLGVSVGAVLILGVALVAGTAVWSRHGRRLASMASSGTSPP